MRTYTVTIHYYFIYRCFKGCYVPARHATIPIRDRILTRLGTSDDMEHNLSSFMSEMKEGAYVLNNVTPNSLVLIDELGRGTSNIDGVSMAVLMP